MTVNYNSHIKKTAEASMMYHFIEREMFSTNKKIVSRFHHEHKSHKNKDDFINLKNALFYFFLHLTLTRFFGHTRNIYF